MESQILELWKRLSPSSAFVAGFAECAGQFFIPTDEALRELQGEIRSLREGTKDAVEQKLLTALERELLFEEPQGLVGDAFGSFFDHITQEGIRTDHLATLAANVQKAFEAAETRATKKRWPLGIKVLTLIRLNGFLELLQTILKERTELRKEITTLQDQVKRYRESFSIPGVEQGTFEELLPLFERDKEGLGRTSFYAQFLKEAFDYRETPDEIEAKGLNWLKRDLPLLRNLTVELARLYKVSADGPSVKGAMKETGPIKPHDLLSFTKELRQWLQPWVHRRLVRINPRYETRLLETPPYLSAIIPSGAMSAYNTLKGNPFQVFFLTTDARRDPPTGVADLMQLILHEEYGHSVNYSNSATGFVARPRTVEMIRSTLMSPITEGISFYLEKELARLFKELVEGKDETSEGKKLLKFLADRVDPQRLSLEHEFVVLDWAVTRYLRVIGDVRINTGKQRLAEFIQWGTEATGLPPKRIYHQIFPAHQATPGYATCYAIVGETIREIKEAAVKKGMDFVEFNTYASGIGFPARTLYEERLRKFPLALVP